MMKKLALFFLALIVLFTIVLFCPFNTNNSDVVNLKFSTWGSASELAILKPIISEFEKENPDIHIDFMHIPQDYFQKVHLLFASDLAPDVLFINNLNLPVYKDHLVDLSGMVDKSLFFPKSVEALSYDDKLYAVPRDVSNLVIFYNKDLFDKCNIQYPDESWSLYDMQNIARRFKEKGVFGISYEQSINYALPYICYFGGGILSDKYEYIADSVNSMKGINFYKNLAYKYHYAPLPSEVGSKTVAQMFLEGRVAMHLSGRWLVPKYRNDAKFNWDIVNFPKYNSPYDASGWAISKSSKNKDAAIKFITFLYDKKNISKMTKDGLIMPARIDVANSSVFLSGKPRNSYIFLESAKHSKVLKISKNYNKYVNKLNTLF